MNNFAVLDIAYDPTPTRVHIITHTNNPVHLTCYYSQEPPGRHKTSRTNRGITLPWGAYFCFVAYKSVEQQEPGDTTTHTFTIIPWVYCETKWFAFRGTVATVLSPSVSCIFKYHHPGVLPFCNLSFEDYPTTPGVPPCWEPASYGEGTSTYERDTVNVQHGIYSCKVTAVGLGYVARLTQRKWSTPYLNKSVKFAFNWFGAGRGSVGIAGYSASFNFGPGWHTWSRTLTLGAYPSLLYMRMGTGGASSSFTQLTWDNITIEILS
jgi:hypothetical protein